MRSEQIAQSLSKLAAPELRHCDRKTRHAQADDFPADGSRRLAV